MRLLHASDLHLGEHTSADGLDECGQRLLRALVGTSARMSADLIIIAGDLFDSNRVSADTAGAAFAELRKAAVPVVILPGNHDCLVADSIYRLVPPPGGNIRIFASPDETFSFPGLDLAIWGKPLASYSGKTRPLVGIPARGPERWRVAVAHGYYAGDSPDQKYSFQITQNEIMQSGCDYVALGHWSEFRCVGDGTVTACYSGSASQANKVAVVELSEDGVRVKSQCLALL